MKRLIKPIRLFLILSMVLPLSAWAAVIAPDAGENAGPQAEEAAIALESGTESDTAIQSRIMGIFGAISGLEDVTVSVSSGVVTLTGNVQGDALADRAESVASRIAGVVTVENQLSRNLDVNDNVAPALSQFADDARNIVTALPLIGVALAIAALIGLLGYFLASFDWLWRKITPNAFLAELVASFVRFAFILLGLVAALEILGATALLGAVLGGAGVIGIALGFAVRDTVDNYVSSLMLSLRQPFRANDHVVIDGHEGLVVRLTTRATILMTIDGNHLRIPNSTVFKAIILNYTTNPERRFEFNLGVDADDNAVEGMKTGLAAVNTLPFILDHPKAEALIADVGDSSIILTFHGWLDQRQTDFAKGRSLAIQSAKTALEEAGFALPEPIYRLRFDQNTSLAYRKLDDSQTEPAKQPEKAPPKSRSPEVTQATDFQTSANTHIEQLVREERAAGTKDDLLDDMRPVE